MGFALPRRKRPEPLPRQGHSDYRRADPLEKLRSSRCGRIGGQLVGLPLLDQLLEDHVALQGAQVIDKERTVQMIDLVLDTGGEQALRLQLTDLVVLI